MTVRYKASVAAWGRLRFMKINVILDVLDVIIYQKEKLNLFLKLLMIFFRYTPKKKTSLVKILTLTLQGSILSMLT